MTSPPSLGPGFEWFVAWRHLRDPDRRSRKLLLLGLALLVLSGGALLAAHLVGPKSVDLFLRPRETLLVGTLRQAGIAGLIIGAVLTFLGVLFASFTVFTAISMFGVFLGTSAPIIALSVMSGFESDLKGKIRGAKADIVITTKDESEFGEWADVQRRIADLPGVEASTPFVEGEVMVISGGTPAGIVLRGIEPSTALSVLDLGRTLREGTVDDLAHPERVAAERRRSGGSPFGIIDELPGAAAPRQDADDEAAEPQRVLPTILLGDELMRALRVGVGGEVEVVCPLCNLGPAGPLPDQKSFRAAGHFYSGMYEFDSKLAYVSLAAAQRLFRMPGEVTGIDVRTRVPDEAAAIGAQIAARIGERYDVRSWQELNKELFMALRLEKIAMFVVLTFIALVASFSIISNLVMLVTEKGREVAILKAMGASDGAILRIFFAEGLYIGLVGLTVGVASGVLGCKLIERFGPPLPTDVYYISSLPVVMRAGEIVTVAASALALCCLATLYPAVLASRLRPVNGLRYE